MPFLPAKRQNRISPLLAFSVSWQSRGMGDAKSPGSLSRTPPQTDESGNAMEGPTTALDTLTIDFLDKHGYFDLPIKVGQHASLTPAACLSCRPPSRTTGCFRPAGVGRDYTKESLQVWRGETMAVPQAQVFKEADRKDRRDTGGRMECHQWCRAQDGPADQHATRIQATLIKLYSL